MNWTLLSLGALLLITKMGSSYEDFTSTLAEIERLANIHTRPRYGGPKNTVEVSVDVERISLNETGGNMEVDLSVTQSWTDPRIDGVSIQTPLVLLKDNIRIWSPNMQFINARNLEDESASRHSIHILSSRKIVKRSRYLVTTECNLNLRFFPMDQQTCKLFIQGSETGPEDINFLTNQSTIKVRTVEPLEFYLVNTSFQILKSPYALIEEEFEVMVLEFTLNRHPFHIILNYYFPSVVCVAFSWLTFWSSSPSNSVGVALTPFIFLLYLTYKLNWYARYLDCIRALDVFSFVSLLIILLSQWEIISKRINRRKVDLKKKMDGDFTEDLRIKKMTLLESRKIFPAVYFGFLLVYWIVLLVNRAT